ncbi:hypothetical protein [Mycobacterium szulgai]|nr:hypothetical protein [Mycobacterium szulgai]
MLIEPSPPDIPNRARCNFNPALAGWYLLAVQLVVVIALIVILTM